MRSFQCEAKTAIEQAVSREGIFVYWNEHPTREIAAMNYGPNDVDVSGGFDFHGQRYVIWIYPDDLGFQSPGLDALFEVEEFSGDTSKQIQAFCTYVRGILSEK